MAPSDVVVYGARYSVYTRIVRLVLEEKGVDYRLEEVDIFAPGGPPADHAERHPFQRIPAFEHDGHALYETSAITRYVDEAFSGPPLQPEGVKKRAAMNQAIAIMDSYGFRTLVWDIFVERIRVPERGGISDEARIASALLRAKTALQALSALRGEARWIAGDRMTLADLHAAPMLVLFRRAPEGSDLLTSLPPLLGWLNEINGRPSMISTRFPIEDQSASRP